MKHIFILYNYYLKLFFCLCFYRESKRTEGSSKHLPVANADKLLSGSVRSDQTSQQADGSASFGVSNFGPRGVKKKAQINM